MLTRKNKSSKLRQTGLSMFKKRKIKRILKSQMNQLSSFRINKKNKMKSFLNQYTQEIEILDFDEPIKYEQKLNDKKKKFRIKYKYKFGGVCVTSLVLILLVISMVTGTNIFKASVNKLLALAGIYNQEIKKVEIKSPDYDEQGSWHINKSARWIGDGKASVIFDVDTVLSTGGHFKDVILVLDTSSSMSGGKLSQAIQDSKELVDYLLTDNRNNVAIITFSTNSKIVSKFSNNKEGLLNQLSSIGVGGNTNYNAALKNVETVMDKYEPEENRDVVTVFLTDGYPTDDTPSEVGTYEILKEKYSYMPIHGVQYEMGKDIIEEIKQVTDKQWAADQATLENILFEAAVTPDYYEDFVITDYIEDTYFEIDTDRNIELSTGSVTTEDNKVIWNLASNSFRASNKAKMEIYLKLKEQYLNNEGFYPTNEKETIVSTLEGKDTSTINSGLTPVLKNYYEVIYDKNTPKECNLKEIPSENHFVYQNVTKKTDKLSCPGYTFKGWVIDEKDEEDIVMVNDDVFIMPPRDVIIRATWVKQNIDKSMDGEVYVRTTLYDVLKNEANSGSNLAKEYTGEHQDSMVGNGTEKIYYYTGDVREKYNVLFAGHCWQMIRTTDTGGVKMIYNGEAENNQCLDTRGTHVGYASRTSTSLNSNYWYGTSYTFDATNKTFKVSGETEYTKWDDTTSQDLVGKYTCKLTQADGTCSILYLVESYYNSSQAYVYTLNANSQYSQFGTLAFNANYSSPADVGYMYNTRYAYKSKSLTSSSTVISNTSISDTAYWYSDSVEWGDPVASRYNLVDPYQVKDSSQYASLVGKYTFRNSTKDYTNTSVYYIVGISGSTMYYIQLSSGNMLEYYNDSYTYGDSYIDNGDGTYTIENPTTIKKTDWYDNYGSLKNKYLCVNANNGVCSSVWYTTSTSTNNFSYINTANNYKYAKGFTYSNGTYKLNDQSVSFWNINDTENQKSLNNAHYTCWNTTGECTNISYIYHGTTTLYYIDIADGKSVDYAVNEMLYNNDVNKTNSTIKGGIDAWYKRYLLEYDDYIEDTIYCNDRTQSNAPTNGWSPIGGSLSTYMQFKNYNTVNDLSCSNVVDQFSVNNPLAQLKYKVGLMSAPEMNLINNSNARKTGQYYWLASPYYFDSYYARGRIVNSFGDMDYIYVNYTSGVRPAVSLVPGTEYTTGDGSMRNPYYVEIVE